MPGFEPQTDVFHVVFADSNPVTANTETNRLGWGVPLRENEELELLSVSVGCTTAPIDADGTVVLDLETVTIGGTLADLGGAATAFNLEGLTANILQTIWQGKQVFKNDGVAASIAALNLEFTSNSAAIDTAMVGLIVVLELRCIKHSR